MSVVAHFEHPAYCAVCGTHGQVKMSQLTYITGRGVITAGAGGLGVTVASKLGVVIPCPQCRGSGPLLDRLPPTVLPDGPGGGAA